LYVTALVLRQFAFWTLVAMVAYSIYLEIEGELSEKTIWAIAWTFCAADLILSLLPGGDPADPFKVRDKLIHVIVNAVLVMLFLLAAVWRPSRGYGRWPHSAATVLFAVLLFGVVIELLQAVVGRDATPLDVIANAIGGIGGLGAWWLVAVRVSAREAALDADEPEVTEGPQTRVELTPEDSPGVVPSRRPPPPPPLGDLPQPLDGTKPWAEPHSREGFSHRN
jgi:VanZ family protein